jgi:hypothetical protein
VHLGGRQRNIANGTSALHCGYLLYPTNRTDETDRCSSGACRVLRNRQMTYSQIVEREKTVTLFFFSDVCVIKSLFFFFFFFDLFCFELQVAF